jgi:hypothetical protein
MRLVEQKKKRKRKRKKIITWAQMSYLTWMTL